MKVFATIAAIMAIAAVPAMAVCAPQSLGVLKPAAWGYRRRVRRLNKFRRLAQLPALRVPLPT